MTLHGARRKCRSQHKQSTRHSCGTSNPFHLQLLHKLLHLSNHQPDHKLPNHQPDHKLPNQLLSLANHNSHHQQKCSGRHHRPHQPHHSQSCSQGLPARAQQSLRCRTPAEQEFHHLLSPSPPPHQHHQLPRVNRPCHHQGNCCAPSHRLQHTRPSHELLASQEWTATCMHCFLVVIQQGCSLH